MNVRVCGPNLTDQSKGTFHVHDARCNDLNYYGPGRRYGGDMLGTRETLVENATVMAVVQAVYADQIAENPDAEAEMDMYINDFWFAPCCKKWLEHGGDNEQTVTETVFECWVHDDKNSFAKLSHCGEVETWVHKQLHDMKLHKHLHIVVHDSGEYTI